MSIHHVVRATLAAAVIASGFCAISLPATAASTAKAKGVVTLNGQPLKGVKVELLYDKIGDDDTDGFPTARTPVVKTDNTNTDGSFAFTGLKARPDTYFYGIRLSDTKGRIVSQRVPLFTRSGKTTTQDVAAHAAGGLVGTVSRADGGSPSSLLATVENFNDDEAYFEETDTVIVSADGSYRFRGLVAGSQAVHVRFSDTNGIHLDQCLGGVPLTSGRACSAGGPAGLGTAVTLAPGTATSLAPETIATPAARVRGTVTDTFGKAIKGLSVEALPVTGPLPYGQTWSGLTKSSGSYQVGSLPTGSYRFVVSDPRGVWATEYLDGKTYADTRVVSVSGGELVTGLTSKVRSRATFKVSVKPSKGAAKVAVAVTRKASKGKPSGTVTVSADGRTKTVTLKKGLAVLKLTHLSKGRRTFTITYSGSGSTAGNTKNVLAVVK